MFNGVSAVTADLTTGNNGLGSSNCSMNTTYDRYLYKFSAGDRIGAETEGINSITVTTVDDAICMLEITTDT